MRATILRSEPLPKFSVSDRKISLSVCKHRFSSLSTIPPARVLACSILMSVSLWQAFPNITEYVAPYNRYTLPITKLAELSSNLIYSLSHPFTVFLTLFKRAVFNI
jgi:hypothetical protein